MPFLLTAFIEETCSYLNGAEARQLDLVKITAWATNQETFSQKIQKQSAVKYNLECPAGALFYS